MIPNCKNKEFICPTVTNEYFASSSEVIIYKLTKDCCLLRLNCTVIKDIPYNTGVMVVESDVKWFRGSSMFRNTHQTLFDINYHAWFDNSGSLWIRKTGSKSVFVEGNDPNKIQGEMILFKY